MDENTSWKFFIAYNKVKREYEQQKIDLRFCDKDILLERIKQEMSYIV